MRYDETHLSEETLLAAVDGELSAREAARVADHLAACWACRARQQEIEAAALGFVRVYRRESTGEIPSSRGPRALLMAQMKELSLRQSKRWFASASLKWAVASLAAFVAAFVAVYVASVVWRGGESAHASVLMLPNRVLTPGATVLMDKDEVCRAEGAGNRAVPTPVQREVFREYGMPSTTPRAYEVDYLITPALGGADDIHNLWPESYATAWNARVKDQLEDYLRNRVCAGTLDLATAQKDLAVNWIDAYKRYFHTDRPLGEDPQ